MAGPSSQSTTTPSNLRVTAHATAATDCSNGHVGLSDPPASVSISQLPTAKKAKGKKAADPSETGKLLAAKINQLELDAAGDKEQELEIGRLFSLHKFSGSIPATQRHFLNHVELPKSSNCQRAGSLLPTDSFQALRTKCCRLWPRPPLVDQYSLSHMSYI